MRILVVHEVDFVSKVVYEWQEFPEALSRAGHEVRVLDYDTHSGWRDLREWGLGPKRETVAWRLDASATFELLRMIGPPVPGIRRLYAAAASRSVLKRVIAESAPDAVLLYAVPTCGRATLRAAHSAGVPVVFRSIDILSELVPRVISAGVHLLERSVYRGCDRVLVANPCLREYVDSMTGRKAPASLVLSPVDTERFGPRPDEAREARIRLGIAPDARVAVFVGSLFGFIGLDRLLDHWPRVTSAEPRAHLLIVGGGPAEASLRARVAEAGLQASVTFTGMRPYDEIPALISAGDVGLCPFELLRVTRNVNPIKVMQYLSCGIPVVCTPLEGTTRVLPEEESGVLYSRPGDDYTETLLSLLLDGDRCRHLGESGRNWVVGHHSFPAIVTALEAEIGRAVEARSGSLAPGPVGR